MHQNRLCAIYRILRSVPERYLLLLLVIAIETIGYFLINDITYTKNTYTVALHADMLLPFIPSFSIFYVTEYILGFLPFLLLKGRKALRLTALLYIAVITISFFIFLLFPVQMLRPELVPGAITEHLVAFIYWVDLPYNAFPSLHIILMLLSGLILSFFRNPAALFVLLMFLPVSLSTLLIKQHYILDVLAGMVIAVLAFFIFLRFMPRHQVLSSQISSSPLPSRS